jgi:hypothetical protein
MGELMTHSPLVRLGCRSGGAQDVREHAWLSAFDTEALLRGELEPPYVPEVQGATDLTNFDEYAMVHDLFAGEPYDNAAAEWDRDF